MDFKIVWLWTDIVVWSLLFLLGLYVWSVQRSQPGRARWRRVFSSAPACASALILGVLLLITLADSLHFRRALPARAGATLAYAPKAESVLDLGLTRLTAARENSYSQPLAYEGFVKETIQLGQGKTRREFPRLKHGGADLKDPQSQWVGDVLSRAALGLAQGSALAVLAWLLAAAVYARRLPAADQPAWREALSRLWHADTDMPWRAMLKTLSVMLMLFMLGWQLSGNYHVFGTDRTGNDVLYQALKSIRTAFVIGSLSQLATLPFAIALGVMAGYFKGWVDTVIEYIYTTVSSVPSILLIAACVLMTQVFIDQHADWFETGLERADLKIFLLCVILGVTGWAGLCRLLRAETLKLRELEYVQAAKAFGVGPVQIMLRHILPNVLHLVIITSVLEFSGLILYEAVLSYVGVGVDPSMNSFGGMINSARLEMSRDPVVWWSFMAAFAFMLATVLAANLFADAVRDAFDPRAGAVKAVRRKRAAASTVSA